MLSSIYTNTISQITSQETQIGALQAEVSSGNAVPTAGTNPGAFVQAARDQAGVTAYGADGANQVALQAKLGTASGTLQQASSTLDSIQGIVLQGLNATTSTGNFQALSVQVGEAQQQMISLANAQGPDGNYLFGGTNATQVPFISGSGGAVSYMGNNGVSNVEVAPGVMVNAATDGTPFLNALTGNGYASVTASASNTGSSTLLAVGVSQQSAANAFQQGTASTVVSFSAGATGGLTYTATQGGTTIATGPISSGNNITLGGIEFQLSGTPATGDQFTIAPARPVSVFDTFQKIQSALASPGSTAAQTAQTRQVLGNALGTINQYQSLMTSTNSKIGMLIKMANSASTSDQAGSARLQTEQSNLTSANMPAVLTQLDQQTTALSATYRAFAVVQQMGSLFNLI